MRATSRRIAIVLAILCAIPSAAFGQQPSERIAELRRTARARMGPFLLWPTLVVTNIGIDDNVLLDPETRDPLSDFTATLTPGVRAVLPVARRALITFTTATGLVWYQDFVSERSMNPSLGVAGEVFIGKFTLLGNGSFAQSSDRPTLEIDERSRHRSLGVSAGARYQFRPKLSVELTGSRRSVRFADGETFLGTHLQEMLNRDTDEARLTLTQTLTPKTKVHLRAQFEQTEFNFSPDRNADGWRVMPGVTFAANALISGTAEVGYNRLNARHPAVPDFSGVVADVDLAYRMLESTHFTAGWARDLDFSYQPSTPYYVVTAVNGGVRRQLFGRFDVILRLTRYNHSYPDRPETTQVDPVEEITRVYAADLGLRLTRYSRVGLAATLADRISSTNPDRVYERLRVGLTLTYGM